MFTVKTITDQQIGLVSSRTGLEKVLESGRHFLVLSKSVQLCNLSDFPANIPNLEWLVSNHADVLAPHAEVVQTGIDEVAMVCSGQKRHFVMPNSQHAFWKKGTQLEIFRLRLDAKLTVPPEWVAKLPIGVSTACVKQVSIPTGAFGLLFVEEIFCDFLLPGRHAYFDVLPKTRLSVCRQSQLVDNKDIVRAMLASGHPACSDQLAPLSTDDRQLALWWDKDELVALSGPASQVLASHALRSEIVNLESTPKSVEGHVTLAMRRSKESGALLDAYVTNYEIPSEHIGMLHVDGVFTSTLQAGFYSFWHGSKRLSLTVIDTRLTVIEISGQEMLTQDKVPLRVNVTAGYKIVDARRTVSSLNDYKDFIYKEIQFALRAAIGSKTLDGLLENKNETDEQILGYVREKAAAQGIEIVSLGIKDLILPGEIKTMLGKVVEAEKAAQANVIRRREETAATRSLMNTSRVMEDNPVALRLKELETLEKITEKIDRISVYGGLESLLKQVAAFKPSLEEK